MAKSQQKPSSKGTRNSDRRNGKAWKKNPAKQSTGKTILGYSKKRFEAMAETANMSLEDFTAKMKAERDRKRAAQKEVRRLTARSRGKGE